MCFFIFVNVIVKWSLVILVCVFGYQLNICFYASWPFAILLLGNSCSQSFAHCLVGCQPLSCLVHRVCHWSFALIIIFSFLPVSSITVNGATISCCPTRNLEACPDASLRVLPTSHQVPSVLFPKFLVLFIFLPLQHHNRHQITITSHLDFCCSLLTVACILSSNSLTVQKLEGFF